MCMVAVFCSDLNSRTRQSRCMKHCLNAGSSPAHISSFCSLSGFAVHDRQDPGAGGRRQSVAGRARHRSGQRRARMVICLAQRPLRALAGWRKRPSDVATIVFATEHVSQSLWPASAHADGWQLRYYGRHVRDAFTKPERRTRITPGSALRLVHRFGEGIARARRL